MARKKLSKEAKKQPQERDLSPVEKPRSLTETKNLETLNQNLKTLNQMLAKETMENRFQIESLKSELEERSVEEPLLFDIERGIYRLVVSSAVSEEKAVAAETARKLEARVRVLEEETAAAVLEREEVERKAKEIGEAFDSQKEMMLEELERSVEKASALDEELRDAVEMLRVSKEEIHMLKKEPEMLRSEVVDLERKNGELKGEVDELREKERQLEMHTMESSLKLEELGEKIERVELEKEELASEIVLLEKSNGELEGDVGRLLESVNGLEKEKEEEKMSFEAKFREYASELADLREQMGVIEREKCAIEQEKAIQEVRILELNEEAMKLNTSLSELHEMENRNGELEAEVCRLLANVSDLEKEKMSLEVKLTEYTSELDDLSGRMGVIEQEKRAVEKTKAIQEVEILELKKEAMKLNSSLSMLHELEKRKGELEGEVDRLLANVRGLEKEREEKETILSAKLREFDDLREKMGAILVEKDAIVQAKENLEVKILELKKDVVELNLSLAVLHELEKRNGELEGEVNGLQKEKEEKETIIAAKISELDDLREKMGAFVQVKAKSEAEILELKEEVMKFNSSLLELQDSSMEYIETNAQLRADQDAARRELKDLQVSLDALVSEKEVVSEQKALLEKSLLAAETKCRDMEGKMNAAEVALREKMGAILVEKDAIVQAKENLEVEILELKKDVVELNLSLSVLHELEKRNGELEGEVNGLQKEKEEKETIIAAKISELDDLRERMGAFVQVKAKSEAEILELKEEVMKFNSSLLELQDSSMEYIETNAQLRADQDAARRELKDLQVSLDALVSEKEVVSEQKALLEKSLLAAETKCRDMEGKMNAAEVASSKALSLLKGTVKAMNGSVEAREIGAVNEDENIRPFLGELESIKTAHHSRVARMEELNRELEGMKSAMVGARKKRGLWMWLYPLTSTFVAAISIAYAAKAR